MLRKGILSNLVSELGNTEPSSPGKEGSSHQYLTKIIANEILLKLHLCLMLAESIFTCLYKY